jgi:hypothetical protein
MLSCLEHLGEPVELISHGPGDVGLSCAVPEAGKQQILSLLHAEFFGETAAAKKASLAEAEPVRDEGREPDL